MSGRPGWKPKNYWTEERANEAIRDLAKQFGRMPSASEIKATIGMGIKGALFKRGLWVVANELGLEIKESDSKFGVGVQVAEAERLRDLGFRVEEQGHHQAPFDLMVGEARVDVKASHYAEYSHKSGRTVSAGYFFGLHKLPATCDVYLLVCVGGHRDGERYYIPASAAQQRMITITPTGKRFAAYRNAIHVLSAALPRLERRALPRGRRLLGTRTHERHQMTTTKKATKKTAPKSRKPSKKYVIVRGSLATFCGYLVAAKGQEVTLSEARMIGYWEKRHMLSTLAAKGPEAGCARLSDATSSAVILDATAILACTEKAATGLREIPTYEVK